MTSAPTASPARISDFSNADNNNSTEQTYGAVGDDLLSTSESTSCCCTTACCSSASLIRFWYSTRVRLAFVLALLMTALNLLFFLCLSVLLIMVSVDVLITLMVQAAVPPDSSFAFGGAAILCVIFPWIAVWNATVSDYSRWPAKYFLLHYHFRVVFGVEKPLRIQDSKQNEALGGTTATAFLLQQQQQRARDAALAADGGGGGGSASVDVRAITEEEIRAGRMRSILQLVIGCIPFAIWFISLCIGVTVGRRYEYGTDFFLTCGFLFVLFITAFEYDIAPSAPALDRRTSCGSSSGGGDKTNEEENADSSSSWTSCLKSFFSLRWWPFDWRSSETSCMRYIIMHQRKFDLSIVGLVASLITSIVVFAKEEDAVTGGSMAFLINLITLSLAATTLITLRCVVSSKGGSMSQANSSNATRHLNAASNVNGNTTAAIRSSSDQQQQQQHDEGTRLLAAASSSSPFGFLSDRDKYRKKLSRKSQFYRHFVLLILELVVFSIACIVFVADAPEAAWPVWLMFLCVLLSTAALFYMQLKSDTVKEKSELLGSAPPPATVLRRQQILLERADKYLDDDTQLVFSYQPAKAPPQVVYRIAYFVVGFVAGIVVFVSCFNGQELATAQSIFSSSSNSSTPPPPASSLHHIASSHRRYDTDEQEQRQLHNANNDNNNPLPQYPICSTKFPGGLSIVDVASIAAAGEMRNRQDQLEIYFPTKRPPAQQHAPPQKEIPNEDELFYLNNRTDFVTFNAISVKLSFLGIDYFSFRFPHRNLTVVQSRGAWRSFDALQQMYVLSDAVSLQLAIMLVPLPSSQRLLSAMIRLVSLLKFGTRNLPKFLVNYIQQTLQKERPHDDILLVGFGLGGFVNSAAAATINNKSVTSVSVAPLNAGFQTKRFGFDIDAGDRLCTNVVAEDDLLARFDKPMGMTQKISNTVDCTLSNDFCHNTAVMLNALSEDCRDPLKRGALT